MTAPVLAVLIPSLLEPPSEHYIILPYSAPIVSPSYFRRVRPCSGPWPQWLSQSGSGPVFFPRIQSCRTESGDSGRFRRAARRGGRARIQENETKPFQMGSGVSGDPLPGLWTTEEPQQRREGGAGGGMQQVTRDCRWDDDLDGDDLR